MTEKRIIGVKEAAELLGVNRNRVYPLLASGEIESVRVAGGTRRMIPLQAIDNYVAKLRAAAQEAAEGD